MEKESRKTGKQAPMITEDMLDPMTGELMPQYGKLFKSLGAKNKNKDVRREMD